MVDNDSDKKSFTRYAKPILAVGSLFTAIGSLCVGWNSLQIAQRVYEHTAQRDEISQRQNYRKEFRESMRTILDTSKRHLQAELSVFCAQCFYCEPGYCRVRDGCGPLGAVQLEIDEVVLHDFEINALYAYEIRTKIPDEVTTMELLALSRALFQCGHHTESRACLEEAKAKPEYAKSMEIKIDAALLDARLHFNTGNPEEGRNIFEAIRKENEETQAGRLRSERGLAHAQIQLTWASTEIYHDSHLLQQRPVIIAMVENARMNLMLLADSLRRQRMLQIAERLLSILLPIPQPEGKPSLGGPAPAPASGNEPSRTYEEGPPTYYEAPPEDPSKNDPHWENRSKPEKRKPVEAVKPKPETPVPQGAALFRSCNCTS